MAEISREETIAALQPGQTRDFDYWQSVFTSVAWKNEAPTSDSFIVHTITEGDIESKKVSIEGLINFPKSLITDNGRPLIPDVDYVITGDGLSPLEGYDLTLNNRLLVIKMK